MWFVDLIRFESDVSPSRTEFEASDVLRNHRPRTKGDNSAFAFVRDLTDHVLPATFQVPRS